MENIQSQSIVHKNIESRMFTVSLEVRHVSVCCFFFYRKRVTIFWQWLYRLRGMDFKAFVAIIVLPNLIELFILHFVETIKCWRYTEIGRRTG